MEPRRRPAPWCPLPPSSAHSATRAFPRLTASLPIGQVGKLAHGACRAPAHQVMVGLSAMTFSLSCEKGRGPSDKALGSPCHRHRSRLYRLPVPPQPCTEAGVLSGIISRRALAGFTMSFLTQASTHGPRSLPCSSQARRQAFPLRQQQEGARAALGKPFPDSQLIPGVPGQAGS